MAQKDLPYQLITDHIVALLEAGTVPWHRPWDAAVGAPRNLVSTHPYRGVNVFVLGSQRFTSPWWLSFPKQVNDLGGRLRAGEKVSYVVFWKPLERTQAHEDGTEDTRRIPLLRYYKVVNALQCTGITTPEASETAPREHAPLAACAALVATMPQRPTLHHGHTQASYWPREDAVYLPNPERFESPEAYYSTLYHELTHATGHASRLNRATLKDMVRFGDTNYSREELVAEMGAAFLCGVTGIAHTTIANSVSYLDGWLRALRADTKLLVIAAAQAQRAADCIRGVLSPE